MLHTVTRCSYHYATRAHLQLARLVRDRLGALEHRHRLARQAGLLRAQRGGLQEHQPQVGGHLAGWAGDPAVWWDTPEPQRYCARIVLNQVRDVAAAASAASS